MPKTISIDFFLRHRVDTALSL